MFKPKSKSKVLSTLNELVRSVRCPNCCKAVPDVCIFECGHSFCRQCSKKLILPAKNGKPHKCPICSRASCDSLQRDIVTSVLAQKTLELKELIFNEIGNSKDDDKSKSAEKANKSKSSEKANKSNLTENEILGQHSGQTDRKEENKISGKDQDMQTDRKEENKITAKDQDMQTDRKEENKITAKDQDMQTDRKEENKISGKDQDMQTDTVLTSSIEVQCDLLAITLPDQRTLSTQTDHVEIDVNGGLCHADKCCLSTNLKRILELNICESFNAIISGLLNASSGDQICNNKPQADESKSNSAQVNQEKLISEKEEIKNVDQKFQEPISDKLDLEKRENGKSDSIETVNKVKEKTLTKEIVNECQDISNVELPKVLRGKSRKANKSQNTGENLKTINDSNSQSLLIVVNKTDLKQNEDDHVFVKPKDKVKTKSKNDKSLKRQISSFEPIIDEENESSAIVAKKSKRIATKKNKDEDTKLSNISKDVKSKRVATKKDKDEDTKLLNISKDVKSVESTSTSSISTNKRNTAKDEQNIYEMKSDESNSSLSRTRSRSSSTEKVKYLVLCSNLTPIQKGKLEKASSMLDFEIAEKWSYKVTHLVVNLSKNIPKKELLTTRSIKYLLALLGNKWIVSFDWMVASVNSNKLVDEKKYEVRGVLNSKKYECPMLSRTQKIVLFSNCAFYFNGNFDNFPLDVTDVKSLVEIGGGILANDQDELSTISRDNSSLKLVIVTDSKPTANSNPDTNYILIGEFLDVITNLQTF